MDVASNRIFTKEFWQLALVNLASMLTFYSLMVSIGPFVVDTYHVSTALSGIVVGVTVIGTLLSRMAAGYLTTIYSPKKLMIVGMLVLVPSLLLYQIEIGVGFLIAVRFIQGIAVGLIGTVTNTAVVFVVPKLRRSEGISYFSLSTIVATAIGPFFALLLTQFVSYSVLFWIEVIIALIGLAVAWSINPTTVTFETKNVSKEMPSAQKAEDRGIRQFLEPRVFGLSALMFVVSFAYASLQSDLDFFAEKIGIGAFASYFFLVYAGVILLSRPFSGRLMDVKSESYIMYPALIILAVGMWLISGMHSGVMLLIAAIFIGIGFGNFQSTIQATVAKLVPSHRLGQANSTYFIFFDAGLGFGPYILGTLIPILGYRHLFIAMAILALIGLPFYYLVHGRHIGKSVY
ncbi:MFS transporter [Periweissella cryptocerci]|uniref:MFS transporter n=1 Tax=Periweissella cryptocerci TaxID=2506420 RepID=A0A4P6YVU2_9LACO|nr:MFS transporter [Periweissella cryptocerci]QBO36934.1 MFS transporter [Periweissella cryptocerci]